MEFEKRNIDYNLRWNIVDRGSTYNPTTRTCTLCIREKFYILYHPRISDLNSKTEIYANCRHKQKILLSKKLEKRKNLLGINFESNLCIYVVCINYVLVVCKLPDDRLVRET